jgi:hypothetical protein
VYECLKDEMEAAYGKSGIDLVANYTSWRIFSTAPYESATHGGRYVTNRANSKGAAAYGRYENVGAMPVGSVLAKDSFLVSGDGSTALGPLFVMQKMQAGFNADSGDWMYLMIMPDGSFAGATNGTNSEAMQFCADCHMSMADSQDSLFFLPEEFRK